MRPQSVIWFERLYLAAIAVVVVNTALSWRGAGAIPGQSVAAHVATTALGFGVLVLLWYFIARRASVIAKWLLVVLIGLELAGLTYTNAGGTGAALGYLAVALQAAAVLLLFRADAERWFATKGRA